jgi:hypothetical protein
LENCDLTGVGLSPRERVTLCEDIHHFSLLLGREAQHGSGETVAATAAAQSDRSPWEHLQRTAHLWPRLEAALTAIAACPDSAAIAEPRSLPIHTARGDPSTLARLARTPADHQAWLRTRTTTERADPARIREPRATHTFRTAPNRIAVGLLRNLLREMEALHRLALFCEEPTAAATADRLTRSLRHWLRATPFCECEPTEAKQDARGPEILLRASPAYRSLYVVRKDLQSGLHVDWSDSAALRFPVLEAWHLFEIWSFLRVGMALHSLGWRAVETDCLRITPSGLHLRLARGSASRLRFRAPGSTKASTEMGTDLDLLYQPLFVSANRTSTLPQEGFRSLSHVMQPDIALRRNGRLLLLDPKYRAYREVGEEQEDVDKMHAYRDAIVRTDTATGRTVPAVDAAWCLFPGAPLSPFSRAEPLRAYPASTPEQPFGTAGVGAVRIRPGAENLELAGLIRRWLDTAG